MRAFWEPRGMEDCKDLDIVTVTTTVGSVADGQALARAILERRLGACVQLEEGLTSCYRWQGKECQDAEVRLTIKTVAACVEPLQVLFAQKHPYELPQFVAWKGQGSPAYSAWVRAEVSQGGGERRSPNPTAPT
jgi:periplasmic divalent cation tolerance protein